ncbi:nucleotidyl transferase AbiEii/AbiGii toxin family protein [Candidatus Uhrbacteria bacterium]|nr:nucleotidyl transferase AbiEii/AbiGii toxin family protein [Candidatus Uhrbacteria bacterium]
MDILTDNHRRILAALGKSKLAKEIYFTGGTHLSYQYLHHRYSLDVDIFSDDLLDDIVVTKAIQDLSKEVGAKKLRHTKYTSRWQYFFEFSKAEIKCDIVYFPFPRADTRIKLREFNLVGDSLLDIAINKVHACFEREAPRDAFDLYTILHAKKWTLKSLIAEVEKKFGVEIDLVHLIARLVASIDLMDEMRPLFIGKPPQKKLIQDYFKSISSQYLKKNLSI